MIQEAKLTVGELDLCRTRVDADFECLVVIFRTLLDRHGGW
jgi:hypothetical protein